MSALPPIATAKAAGAVQTVMSALGHKRTSRQVPLLLYPNAEIARVEAFDRLRLPGGSGTSAPTYTHVWPHFAFVVMAVTAQPVIYQ